MLRKKMRSMYSKQANDEKGFVFEPKD
jgi:hypothetical protein